MSWSEEQRKQELKNLIDYELCARCNHFHVCHRKTCEAWTEGDRDDLVIECNCPGFEHSFSE